MRTIQHFEYDNVLTSGHDLLQLPPTLHNPPGQNESPSIRGRLLVVSQDLLHSDHPGRGPRGVESLSEEMRINIPENQSQSSYLELLRQARGDLLQVTRNQRQDQLLVFHLFEL